MRQSSSTAGSSSVNADPSTLTLPPCRSTIAETIESPSPDPGRPDEPVPRQNRSNSRSRSAGSGPGPSSRTVTNTIPLTRDSEIVTRPPSGPWTSAFSTRFSSARASAS